MLTEVTAIISVGGLVKKILESKKEYAQSEQNQQNQTKTKIDKSSVNDATRHKEKEMVRKEVGAKIE